MSRIKPRTLRSDNRLSHRSHRPSSEQPHTPSSIHSEIPKRSQTQTAKPRLIHMMTSAAYSRSKPPAIQPPPSTYSSRRLFILRRRRIRSIISSCPKETRSITTMTPMGNLSKIKRQCRKQHQLHLRFRREQADGRNQGCRRSTPEDARLPVRCLKQAQADQESRQRLILNTAMTSRGNRRSLPHPELRHTTTYQYDA